MKNKIDAYLLSMKKTLISGKIIINTIFYWQLFLTLFVFSAGNLLVLFIVGIIYLLNLFIYI